MKLFKNQKEIEQLKKSYAEMANLYSELMHKVSKLEKSNIELQEKLKAPAKKTRNSIYIPTRMETSDGKVVITAKTAQQLRVK